MRKALLSGVALVAFGLDAVSAADLPAKAPSWFSPVPVHNWTGLYVGAHLGAIGGNFTNTPLIMGPTGDGGSVMGGVQIGYNWQVNQLVFGVEADTSAISVKASGTSGSFEEDWLTTVRGRLGYAWDRYLAYLTLGVGFTNVTATAVGSGSTSKVQSGLAIGVGLEAVLWSPQWTGRAEYLYVDVPKDTYLIGTARVDGGSDNHIGRVAINYKIW
jgi:outer membrane immunogenic protein